MSVLKLTNIIFTHHRHHSTTTGCEGALYKIIYMKPITHLEIPYTPLTGKGTQTTTKNLWKQFIDYADGQQSKRLLWMAIGVLGHGTIFTILTLITVIFTGNIFALFTIACCAMVMVVIVNLAAMPTKVTIPVFFISLVIDIAVIITAILLR